MKSAAMGIVLVINVKDLVLNGGKIVDTFSVAPVFNWFVTETSKNVVKPIPQQRTANFVSVLLIAFL